MLTVKQQVDLGVSLVQWNVAINDLAVASFADDGISGVYIY